MRVAGGDWGRGSGADLAAGEGTPPPPPSRARLPFSSHPLQEHLQQLLIFPVLAPLKSGEGRSPVSESEDPGRTPLRPWSLMVTSSWNSGDGSERAALERNLPLPRSLPCRARQRVPIDRSFLWFGEASKEPRRSLALSRLYFTFRSSQLTSAKLLAEVPDAVAGSYWWVRADSLALPRVPGCYYRQPTLYGRACALRTGARSPVR